MSQPNLRLQKPLEDFIDVLEKLTPRTLPLLTDLFMDDVSFCDPYYRVRGSQDMERLFLHRINSFDAGRYRVVDFMWGRRAATAYISWSFAYTVKKETIRIDGMSEIMFTPDGKILSYDEFWSQHNANHLKQYLRSKDLPQAS